MIFGRLLAGAAFSIAVAVGSVSVPGVAQAAAAMTFRLEPTGHLDKCRNRCPLVIVADGEIRRNTPERFARFIRSNLRQRRMRAVVFVNSPGGLVVASMRLGKLFRKLGAAVVVAQIRPPANGRGRTIFTSGRCYSACVYALMGAKKRVVPPQSSLVVHRMFVYEMLGDSSGGPATRQKTYRNEKLYKDLTRYARMMGVSSSVIYAAESTPAGEVRVIS
ncbi:MAG: hypothetical protein KDJ29_14625, partial [Hyphomicrobiales bacterium]|nr:hypothetical protein [Hyphomicrobiales bacterium]